MEVRQVLSDVSCHTMATKMVMFPDRSPAFFFETTSSLSILNYSTWLKVFPLKSVLSKAYSSVQKRSLSISLT